MTAVKGIRVVELANNELKVEYPYSGVDLLFYRCLFTSLAGLIETCLQWQMPGVTPRRPFIIAVSGGTASGKVNSTPTNNRTRQRSVVGLSAHYQHVNRRSASSGSAYMSGFFLPTVERGGA